jgi:hypothetical protein
MASAVAGPRTAECRGCGAEVLAVTVDGQRVLVEVGERSAGAAGVIAVDEQGRARRLAKPGLGRPRQRGESMHDQHRCA